MKLLFGGFARAKTLQGPCRILFYPTVTPYVLSDKILSPFSIIFFYFSTSIGNVGTSNKDNKFIGIIIIIIMKFITVIFFLSALCCSIANAFSSSSTTQVTTSLLPTFDKKTQRWSPAEGSEEEPYGLGRTLLGNGPVPAFTRITQSDDYMQAVLKFQANEKSTIRYAQGNMDAYFENPNDWAYQRTFEDRGGYKKKYGEPLDKKQFLLTVVWGLGISSFIVNFGYNLISGNICDGHSEMQFCKVFFN